MWVESRGSCAFSPALLRRGAENSSMMNKPELNVEGVSKVEEGNAPKFNIQPTLAIKMILFYLERILHRGMRTEFGVKWNLNPGIITSFVTLSKFLKLSEPQHLQL